jgi:hypothetical protein
VEVADGQSIDLSGFTLGTHALTVVAEDVAGNRAETTVSFTVVDTIPPEISIASPTATSYAHHELVPVDVEVTDAKSGVADVTITLDGQPVADGDVIDLLELALGDHTLAVHARDASGNVADAQVTFTVEATLDSLQATVARYADEGVITNGGTVRSLERMLEGAQAALARGDTEAATNLLHAFEEYVRSQSGSMIPTGAAELLETDAATVRATL